MLKSLVFRALDIEREEYIHGERVIEDYNVTVLNSSTLSQNTIVDSNTVSIHTPDTLANESCREIRDTDTDKLVKDCRIFASLNENGVGIDILTFDSGPLKSAVAVYHNCSFCVLDNDGKYHQLKHYTDCRITGIQTELLYVRQYLKHILYHTDP